MPQTLLQWLDWQEHLHPVTIDLGLERLQPVAVRLGLMNLPIPVITVAGTNGKGSSVAFLEALLATHGLSSGSYSSPWLRTYNESVRINMQAVSDVALIQAFNRVEQARQAVSLTCFECRTLAAVDLITNADVDVAILEVGLGGRLDAVNLFAAQVSLITTVGLDHQDWLGVDLESIVREKAGVMRSGRICVSADESITPLLEPHAHQVGARLLGAQRDYCLHQQEQSWSYRNASLELTHLPLPALRGRHQIANAAGAITALNELAQMPELTVDSVSRALLQATLAGRLEFHPGTTAMPAVLFDVAHNPQACGELARWLENNTPTGNVLAVCGMYRDKDPEHCLSELEPLVSQWFLGDLPLPRGGQAQALRQVLPGECRKLRCYATITMAIQDACSVASDTDLVVVFGSFETVRQAMAVLDNAD